MGAIVDNLSGFSIYGGTFRKTFIVTNSLTFIGVDNSTLNIGNGGVLGSNAYSSETYLTTIAGIPAGGDLTGTYPNPTITTINSTSSTFYDPTSSIQTQINSKQNLITLGTTLQYFRGDLSLATFPTSIPPGGSAGGDLSGTYPNPTVNQINGITKTFYDPTSSIQTQINSKQDTLISGTNIKTINSVTLLGSTDILLQTPLIAGTDYLTPTGSAAGLTGLTSGQVTTALTYTPYNATNPSGYISTISGIAAGGALSGTYPSPSLVSTFVTGALITGYVSGAGVIVAGDSILGAIQKLNGNIGSLTTGVSSVTNSDGTLTISPTSGAVIASVALNHANAWTNQTFTSGTVFNSLPTGTGVASAATVSTLVSRDSNGNSFFNNSIEAFATNSTNTATAITLTAASPTLQYYTGSNIRTITLPDVTTLAQGFTFEMFSTGSGFIQVNSFGGNNIVLLEPGSAGMFTCILTTGTTAASWQYSAIGLGQTLINITQITLNGQALNIAGTYATIQITDDPGASIAIGINDGVSTNASLTLDPGVGSLLSWNNGTGIQSLNLSGTGGIILTDYDSIGIVNAGNYEANFVARSLVTKQYVTSLNYFSNPMTTLGDIIYGGTSGVATRLVGNITSTKKFLTQTGTGSVSAAPAYYDLFGTVASWTALQTFGNNISIGGTTVSGATGSGANVFATSPALITPALGAASATTINNVTITTPATAATLTILNNKTFTVNNTLILAGTDSSTLNIGAGGTLGSNAFNSTSYSPLVGSSSLTTIGTIGSSPYTTAGVIHNSVTSGAFTSSLIVNADITNSTIAAAKLVGTDIATIGSITSSPYTTAGIIHNTVTTGAFTSSLIVNADITNTTIDLTAKVTGLLPGTNGGTGVNNGVKTITLGGNLTHSGAFATTLIVTNTTSVTLPTSGTLAILGANTFTGLQTFSGGFSNALAQTIGVVEGTGGRVGQTTLVAGTKAITITGITTSSRAFPGFVSQGGTSTGVYAYAMVCTANTLTITAETVAGVKVATDTSTINYVIFN